MNPKSIKGRRPVRVLAAAAAAVAAPAGHAQAQSNVPSFTPKTMISAEGGFLFANYQSPIASIGKVGLPGSSNNTGGYGAISFGQDINPFYDWRISGAFNAFRQNNQGGSTSGLFFTDTTTQSDKFSFLTFDFDVGRRWENGNLQLRTFAGFRGLRTADNFGALDTTVSKLGTSLSSLSGDSHFTGLGPRVGLEMFYGSTFGVVGSVSAAAIFGVRDSTFTSNVDGVLTNMGQNKWTWVENISGSLGLSWQFAPGYSVVVGYKADQWWNIRDNFSYTGMTSQGDKDVLTHGPFLRVTVRQ